MSYNSPIGALRKYKKENKLNENSFNPSYIVKLINNFVKTYSLHDLQRSGGKSLLRERIPTVKEAIDATINKNQSTSIGKVSRSTGVPSASVHRIMRKCIGLYPYKLQMLQELKKSDYICRLNFCAWLRNNYSKLNNIFWSDEAYLHLDDDISHYHCRIWTMQNLVKALLDEIKTSTENLSLFNFTATFKLQLFFFELFEDAATALETSIGSQKKVLIDNFYARWCSISLCLSNSKLPVQNFLQGTSNFLGLRYSLVSAFYRP